MKLFTRYNYVNLATTIVVLFITGIVYYQAISWILTYQKDKELRAEEQEISDYVHLNHHLPQTFETSDQQITFFEAKPGTVKRRFFNTSYFKKHDHEKGEQEKGEFEPGRGLITSVQAAGKFYKVLIVVSRVETEDLIQLIFSITVAVVLVLLLTLLITNRLILNRLWRPFYHIMRELKLFSIAESNTIMNVETGIDEFAELNSAVMDMAGRAKYEYARLKSFTENASHELLTPIAVINSKLDTLIQTENFSDRQSQLLNDLYTAVSRLSKLNQSLLLLTKIENRLLHEQQSVDLRILLEEMVVLFDEIFQDKKITPEYTFADKEIVASRYLVDVLLNNLITNAIRHNYAGGKIMMELTPERFIIKNTGEDAALNDEHVFSRFHKSSKSDGTGLGLTISKQICESYGFKLNYSYIDDMHTFTVIF